EKQIASINLVSPENRILHLDATGQLVRIGGINYKYQAPLNHFAVLKDRRAIGCSVAKSLLVSEIAIIRAYHLLNGNKPLVFRIIVSDYSFANIHACLRAYNDENINEYALRVFRLAQGYLEVWPTDNKSWLVSCASHTMKRYVDGLKSLVKDTKIRSLASLGFSLLLNSLNLSVITYYFKLIVYSFLDPKRTQRNYDSLTELQRLIRSRPNEESEIINILNCKNLNLGESQEYEFFSQNSNKESIKSNSPFTKYFNEIEKNVSIELSLESGKNNFLNDNEYFSPTVIKYLQEKYMPYAFFWASFTLNKVNGNFTRLTNGLIEKFIGYRKSSYKTLNMSRLNPAQYSTHVYPLTDGKTERFINYQTNEIVKVKLENEVYNEPYLNTLADPEIAQSNENVQDISSQKNFQDVFDEVENLMRNNLNAIQSENNQKLDSELPEVDLTLNKNDNEREFDRKENDWSRSKEQWGPKRKVKPFINEGFFQKPTNLNLNLDKPILAESSNSHLKRYETDEISQLDILSDNEENDKHKQTKNQLSLIV
ncbi:unnamed protein product, partial [Brachionus calyciflorus]